MLTKIDNRLKVQIHVLCFSIPTAHMSVLCNFPPNTQKIINTVIKELDAVARQSIREELAGLDAALGGNLASQPPELVRRATGLED